MNENFVFDLESLDWDAIFRRSRERIMRVSSAVSEEDNKLMTKTKSFQPYEPVLLERLHLQPEWSLLDVACGKGELTMQIAKIVRSVLAIDTV